MGTLLLVSTFGDDVGAQPVRIGPEGSQTKVFDKIELHFNRRLTVLLPEPQGVKDGSEL